MRAVPHVRGGYTARVVVLVFGLFLFAVGIVLQLESELGLSPWDVLHQGLAKHTPLTFGTANVVVAAAVVVVAWRLGARVGVGTVANAVLVGGFIELLTRIDVFERPSEHGSVVRALWLGTGIATIGVASALYLGAHLGAGPRDSLMVVGSQRTGLRLGIVRAALELSALAAGLALGGKVGVGTLAFALAVGPAVEAGCWLLLRTPFATATARPARS